jgi:nitrogen regulatory protein PII
MDLYIIMVALLLVFRSSMTSDMQEVLRECGVDAYTLIPNASGKGETGNVVGSFFYPGSNSVILSVLPDNQVDGMISALQTFHAARLKSSQGRPIPFKLFSFPCRELI